MGVVDVLGPLAARPRPGEVPDERQGGVPHVPADVLSQGPARRQAPLQGLPDQTRTGSQQPQDGVAAAPPPPSLFTLYLH